MREFLALLAAQRRYGYEIGHALEDRFGDLQSLRDLNAVAANGHRSAADLLLEGAILHLKADLERLDLIEQRLAPKGDRE